MAAACWAFAVVLNSVVHATEQLVDRMLFEIEPISDLLGCGDGTQIVL